MALNVGTRIGPYEIIEAIGAGGMGEVYRARDTHLKRDVAIKVLPEAFAQDPDWLARFQREAEVLATLNHPNIAAVYGLEKADGLMGIVLELVEGQTLAELIAGPASGAGPSGSRTSPARGLPIDEALALARQIADALEAAHEQGIVHRDLKPANIKRRPDGTVKVLDFGLAKLADARAAENAPSALAFSQSPTITTPAMTMAGVILGTAAYMSPEQAKGRPADRRSDLWAFGCVLFEMLTGKRAFDGEDVSDIFANVLKSEPDWSSLPPDTPRALQRLLRRCLERDRHQRWQSAADARLEIDEAQRELRAPSAEPISSQPAAFPTLARIVAAVAVLLVMLAGGFLWGHRLAAAPTPVPPETRLEITTPPTDDPTGFALSPDGRRLVFVATGANGQPQLWLRPLDDVTAQPLPGTDGATQPFWKPNSQSVAFFADDRLKRLDLGAGLPRVLTKWSGARGGAWGPDDVILLGTTGPLSRIPASGGNLTTATALANGERLHMFPQFLPGGQRFLLTANTENDGTGIYEGSFDGPTVNRVTTNDSAGLFLPPDWLLFVRQGSLFATHFDAAHGSVLGDPIAVADALRGSLAGGSQLSEPMFSVSNTGLIAFRMGDPAQTELTWFDRTGKRLGTPSAAEAKGVHSARVSPDGDGKIVGTRTVDGNTDLWLLDAARGTRFTLDPLPDLYPVWSPDGRRIAFTRRSNLLMKTLEGEGKGNEETLLESPTSKAPQSWSRSGRYLLFTVVEPKTGTDLWVLDTRERKACPFVNSSFSEQVGQFSPDDRWVAYETDASGRYQIAVRGFDGSCTPTSGEAQFSNDGGVTPRWAPDGKELYYIAPDAKLMAVPVEVRNGGIEPGRATALFQTQILFGGRSPWGQNHQFDVDKNGRFLIDTVIEKSAAPIVVIQNWQSALSARENR